MPPRLGIHFLNNLMTTRKFVCKIILSSESSQDYSEAVRMKRKEILPKLKEARETGDIACQRHDKPIIVNQTAHQNNADTSDHSSKVCSM